MKKVNVFGKLGVAAGLAIALSVGACNNAAPEAAEDENTEEAVKADEHDHDHEHEATDDEHPAGDDEHPTGGGEHPN